MLDRTTFDPISAAAGREHSRFVLAVVLALFAGVFALRLAIEDPNAAIGLLYGLPVSIVALYFGTRAALASAVLAVALVGVAVWDDRAEPLALMIAAAFIPYSVIAAWVADQLREVAVTSREAEEGLNSIIETLKEAFLSMSPEGRITDMNAEAEKLFGRRRADVLGADLAETILPPLDRREFHENLERFLAGEHAPLFGRWLDEVVAMRCNGGTITVEMLIAPVRRGGAWEFPVFVFDISARVRAEEASSRLAAVVESSDDAIFGYTLAGEITAWNSGAERIFGYSAGEIVGEPVSLLVPPDRPDDAEPVLTNIAEGGRIEQYETQRLARGGRRIDVSVSVSPVRDRRGTVIGASSVARDISYQKRVESHRANQYRATRLLAESAEPAAEIPRLLEILGEGSGWPCGVVWYRDGDNRRMRCAVTWKREDIEPDICPFESGQAFDLDADPPSDVTWEKLREVRTALPGVGEAERAGIGTVLWVPVTIGGVVLGAVELMTRRVLDREEEMIASTSTVSSLLTELMKRRHAETEAERLKDDFFGMVSHEMRTPLTSIIGYTELLSEYEAETLSEQGRGFLGVIERNARREMRLVGDLLALVRIEAGTFSVDPESVDLATVAREALDAAAPRAEQDKVSLGAVLDRVPASAGDPHRLGQVLDNLLSNAIKFTPEGGRVELSLARNGDTAVIEVSDTGVGIPPDEQDRLFDRLYRSRIATEQHFQGLGLGLTIAKAIVEAHDGRISVCSDEGEGATFKVELPLRPPPAETDGYTSEEAGSAVEAAR